MCLNFVDEFTIEQGADGSSLQKCLECNNDVPQLYVRDYEKFPPAVFSIIGFRSHGKSVFLGSLFHELTAAATKNSPKEWPHFSYSALDQMGMDQVLEIKRELEERKLPAPTLESFFQPAILRMRDLPKFGSRHLLAYDTSGELLQQTSRIKSYQKGYISRVSTVVLIVSWKQLDVAEQSRYHLDDLITIYREALISLGGDPQQQSLLVVLSKGDRLLGEPGLPERVTEFLKPVASNGNGSSVHENGDAAHFARLDTLSQEIELWLESQPHFSTFVREARAEFHRVEYCVATATGHEANGNVLPYDIAPRGVLSSLLWTLRLQTPDAQEEQAHKTAVAEAKRLLEHKNYVKFFRQANRDKDRLHALEFLTVGRGRTLPAKKLVLEFRNRNKS